MKSRTNQRRTLLGSVLGVGAVVTSFLIVGPMVANAAEGDFNWAVGSRGSGANATGNALAVDSQGNSYATGWFQSTEDFAGDGTGGQGDITSAGDGDMFLVSYSPAGAFRWVKRMGGVGFDPGTGLAVDSSDSVVVTGSFKGTVDFAGDGIGGAGDLTALGNNDLFVAKYTASGTLSWVRKFGGTAQDGDWEGAVTTDSSNNIYMTGPYMGTGDFGSDGIGGTGDITSLGSIDAALAKLSSTGSLIWVRGIGGTGNEYPHDLAVDSSGNVVLSASSDSATVDTAGDGIGGSGDITTKGNYDAIVAKYNSSGNFQWAKSIGGASADWAAGVTIGSGGRIVTLAIVAGTFDTKGDGLGGANGSDDMTSYGSDDMLLESFTSAGTLEWAKHAGGTSGEAPTDVTADSNGNLYVTGGFQATSDFAGDGPGGSGDLVSLGALDWFLAKYNSSGAFQWVRGGGEGSGDQGGFLGEVALDSTGSSIFITDQFQYNSDFAGDGSGGAGDLPGTSLSNFFLVKFSGPAVATTTTTSTTSTSTSTTSTTVVSLTTTSAPSTTVQSPNSTFVTIPSGGGSTGSTVVTPKTSVVKATTSSSTVAPTLVTTTVPPTTTTTEPAPVAPEAAPGEAGATVDGESVETKLSRSDDSLLVTAGDVSLTVYGLDPAGQRVALDADGNLQLSEDDRIVVSASGYESGTLVEVWLRSTPTKIGTVAVDSLGRINGTFNIPRTIDAGDHRVVLAGRTKSGGDSVIGVGLRIGAYGKESNVNRWIIVSAIILAVALALILPTTARRRRRAA